MYSEDVDLIQEISEDFEFLAIFNAILETLIDVI